MEQTIEKMLRRYGRDMQRIRNAEKTALRGFFQPDTGKVERMEKLQPGPLGLENRRRYIYIGLAQTELRQDDEVEADGKRYLVRSAQTVFGTEKPAYVWAMCVEKGA